MDTKYVDSRIADAKKIANLIINSVPDSGFIPIINRSNKDWKSHPDKLRMKRTMDKEVRKLKKLKGEVRYNGKYTFEKEKIALECKRLRDILKEKMGDDDWEDCNLNDSLPGFIGLLKDSAVNNTISFSDIQPDLLAAIDRIGGYVIFPAHLTKLKPVADDLQKEVLQDSCKTIRVVIGDKTFSFR